MCEHVIMYTHVYNKPINTTIRCKFKVKQAYRRYGRKNESLLFSEYFRPFSKSGLLRSMNVLTSFNNLYLHQAALLHCYIPSSIYQKQQLFKPCAVKGKKHTREAAILESLRTSSRQWLACYVVARRREGDVLKPTPCSCNNETLPGF